MSPISSTRIPAPAFWRDRRVLVTGHTGFKGSWLTMWLTTLGARVAGVSLSEPPSTPALWSELGLDLNCDIRADVAGDDWQEAAAEFDPHIVIHLAAQPLVAAGYADPLGTFQTNVIGTAKVLALSGRLPHLQAVLIATTDKVYDSSLAPPYVESTPLAGTDPYAASKVGAELVVRSWPDLGVPAATARAGNVIGGGDWGSHRLLPDLIRAWSTGATPSLRRPDAVRPWQHVLEPLGGYLVYLEQLACDSDLPRALNFGPDDQQAVTVREVVDHAAGLWNDLPGSEPATYEVIPNSAMKETQVLEIESTAATDLLGWRSTLGWREAVRMTVEWYAAHARGADPAQLVRDQLRAFTDSVTE